MGSEMCIRDSRVTCALSSRACKAAVIPAGPPPTTSRLMSAFTRGSNGQAGSDGRAGAVAFVLGECSLLAAKAVIVSLDAVAQMPVPCPQRRCPVIPGRAPRLRDIMTFGRHREIVRGG